MYPLHAYQQLSNIGATALDRLSIALGGAIVLKSAEPVIGQYIADTDWRRRRAALLALALLGEGCGDILYKQLPTIIPAILSTANDPHARVRYQLFHCIGQMCADFGEPSDKHQSSFQVSIKVISVLSSTVIDNHFIGSYRTATPSVCMHMFASKVLSTECAQLHIVCVCPYVSQSIFHQQILPLLADGLTGININAPRVQSIVAASITQFCHPSYCKASWLLSGSQPVAPKLLTGLMQLIMMNTTASSISSNSAAAYSAREEALTACATVAQALGIKFEPYYQRILSAAKALLQQTAGNVSTA
jgi:HEAT-like repeat